MKGRTLFISTPRRCQLFNFQATVKEKETFCQRYELSECKRAEFESRIGSLSKEVKSSERQLSCVEQQLQQKQAELDGCRKATDAAAKNYSEACFNIKFTAALSPGLMIFNFILVKDRRSDLLAWYDMRNFVTVCSVWGWPASWISVFCN